MEHQIERARFIVDLDSEMSSTSAIDINANDPALAFKKSQALENLFQDKLVYALDKVLSKWLDSHSISPDTIVTLTHLELDLGKISSNLINDEVSRNEIPFEDAEGQLIERKLYEQLSFALKDTPPQCYLPEEWKLKSICHFLHHGTWLIPQVFDNFSQAQSFLQNVVQVQERLLAWLTQNSLVSHIWERLFYQSDTSLLANLRILASSHSANIDAKSQSFSRNISSHFGDKKAKEFFHLWSLCAAMSGDLYGNESALKNDTKDRHLQDVKPDFVLSNAGIDCLTRLFTFVSPNSVDQQSKNQNITSFIRRLVKQAPKTYKSSKYGQALNEDTFDSGEYSLSTERGAKYIQNAGLVILHPFLASLFEQCEFTRDAQFVDNEAKAMAISLMHFLVYDETTAPENLTQLNKFLVAWPHKQALPKVVIQATHKQHCLSLLEAAVEHWQAIGSTSINGFQSAFLQREGLLSGPHKQSKYNNHQLVVEAKPYDMLLQKLPWSLSPIKLPWLDDPLIVDWTS